MGVFNFLEKSAKHIAEETAQKVEDRLNERLGEHFRQFGQQVSENFSEIHGYLRRIETKQKEISLQMEEIDSQLHGDGDEAAYVSAVIALADIIEDFYAFAAEDMDSPFFSQAQMMWNLAKSKAEAAGLTIIDAFEEPFDYTVHSIEGTAFDDGLPTGYVIKTLKCGYIFKDEIIRPAAVIVNKQETIVL